MPWLNRKLRLGFLFLALDPSVFRNNLAEFSEELASLAQEIRDSPAIYKDEPVRLPGDRSNRTKKIVQETGTLEIEENIWNILCQMSTDPSAGVESTNLTN